MRLLLRLLVLFVSLGCLVYQVGRGMEAAPADRQEPTLYATILMALILAVAVNTIQNFRNKRRSKRCNTRNNSTPRSR